MACVAVFRYDSSYDGQFLRGRFPISGVLVVAFIDFNSCEMVGLASLLRGSCGGVFPGNIPQEIFGF